MVNKNSRNPEKLLEQFQQEEERAEKGQLKIYFGAAPGVGKTYAMLQDALALKAQGLDVVVGVVESHGRKEIEFLIKNFEKIPLQKVVYREKTLLDFDIDTVLKRAPALVLVDEMAHTNIPGMRHPKRWQDIKELIDRGIDVYTTLNVQHIESLSDIVEQITHIRTQEVVPDVMLDSASSIELVDLPPEDLLKRLEEGKIYVPEQIKMASTNFFRKGNLIALRELALRVTAEHVSVQTFLYRQGEGIQEIWATREKILVCVSGSPESLKLIRAARRIAMSLQAPWIAVHVETPKMASSDVHRNKAIHNLRIAEQLGSEIRILTGSDIVKEIMLFAREQNITLIAIWKAIRSRWHDMFFKNMANELVRNSGEIDVYIMTGKVGERTPKKLSSSLPFSFSWKGTFIAVGAVFFATIINFFLFPYFNTDNLMMVYLLSVTLVALRGQMGPALLASVLGVLAYDFFFIPPLYSFAVSNAQYLFTLIGMLILTQIISALTLFARREAFLARRAERRTAALYKLSQQLAHTRNVDKLLEVTVHYIGTTFNSQVIGLLVEDNSLSVRACYQSEGFINEKEEAIMHWVYELGQMAGFGTDTLSSSDSLYVPLLASGEVLGILKITPNQAQTLFTPEQMQLLEACTHQVALALEVDKLEEQVISEPWF